MTKIGIFSTFIEPAALELVQTVQNAVRSGDIPNTEISFIFSNRERGESQITDGILDQLSHSSIPLICFSARKFKPETRIKAKKEEEQKNVSSIQEWRNEFGAELLKRLPATDIDLALGDLYIWGDNLCEQRNGINLHPALPTGPKGEWYKVIWELIQNKATETGVMMHKITKKLDEGPPVTSCRFGIQGYQFDSLWNQLPQDDAQLKELIEQGLSEKEKTQHPLHRRIRQYGLTREFPLIIQTAKSFAQGEIRFGENCLDLTKQIDELVVPLLEGRFSPRKEVKV